VVANAGGTAVQSTHYYPFGMLYANSLGSEKQPYKYSGKELDNLHGLDLYDSQARWYSGAIPGFTTQDPLAEKYYGWSPYGYCKNNPLIRIDPDGRDDYFNRKGEYLGTDGAQTSELRLINTDVWSGIMKGVKHGMPSDVSIKQFQEGSKIISVENAGNKFSAMWNESAGSKETAGYIVFDPENASITFERVTVENASSNGGYISKKAGDKFGENGIILGNVPTHPTEHEYIGKIAANTGQPIDDQYNFNFQYETDNSDGRRAQLWQGANYTISKYNVDYYSPLGKEASKNNLTTRTKLNNNQYNLLRHALFQYGKK